MKITDLLSILFGGVEKEFFWGVKKEWSREWSVDYPWKSSRKEETPAPEKKPEVIPAKKAEISSSFQITPLLHAVLSGDLKLVQATLAEHPEMLNIAYAPNGNTPLHVAALNGYTEIMQFLLTQPNIAKDRKNNDGKTAFDLAAEKKNR